MIPNLLFCLCVPAVLLSQAQPTTQPARVVPVRKDVELRFYMPPAPPTASQPYSLVVELDNLSSRPIEINQPIVALSARYRLDLQRGTAGKDTFLFMIYFERPPDVPQDTTRDQPVHRTVATVQPGKSHLVRVDIPQDILAPGDNRFTAVLYQDGAAIGESSPLVLHCDALPAK